MDRFLGNINCDVSIRLTIPAVIKAKIMRAAKNSGNSPKEVIRYAIYKEVSGVSLRKEEMIWLAKVKRISK